MHTVPVQSQMSHAKYEALDEVWLNRPTTGLPEALNPQQPNALHCSLPSCTSG